MLSDDISTLEKYINRQDTSCGITIEAPTQTRYNSNHHYDYNRGSVSRFRPPARFIRECSTTKSRSNLLPKPSKEQRRICNTAQKGYNVVIISKKQYSRSRNSSNPAKTLGSRSGAYRGKYF